MTTAAKLVALRKRRKLYAWRRDTAAKRQKKYAALTKTLNGKIRELTKPVGAKAALKIAAAEIGTREDPIGSNSGPRVDTYQSTFHILKTEWCGAFQGWVLKQVGVPVTDRIVFCPYIQEDAIAGRNGFVSWTTDHRKARPGDLVIFDWEGDGSRDHVAMLEKPGHATITTIEGNTGYMSGYVERRKRSTALVLGYARPRYA